MAHGARDRQPETVIAVMGPEEAAPGGAPPHIGTLIRTTAQANARWGAPGIRGELLKLGIDVSDRQTSEPGST